MVSCGLLLQHNIFCVRVQRTHRIFLPRAEGTKMATIKDFNAYLELFDGLESADSSCHGQEIIILNLG